MITVGSGGAVTLVTPARVSPTFGSGVLFGNSAVTAAVGFASLPFAGGNTSLIALAGLALLGTGGGLMLAGRRI